MTRSLVFSLFVEFVSCHTVKTYLGAALFIPSRMIETVIRSKLKLRDLAHAVSESEVCFYPDLVPIGIRKNFNILQLYPNFPVYVDATGKEDEHFAVPT
jgi:hypothetical protein